MHIPSGDPGGPTTGIAQAWLVLQTGPVAAPASGAPASGTPPSPESAHATAGRALGGASAFPGVHVPADALTMGAVAEPFPPDTGVHSSAIAGVVGPLGVH